ncbi:hypothetical protein A3G50_01735 [Candidatus Jorgensenbacteria bacterium RIFCSPLOWO2_12_FULL_42_11]|uniref:MtN3 and saliva related transmembrane protein n=1 Tax=Candidatus Jorgensenbacteria bacterium RIFCSPLOWO2_12_FULL_42_11 TaxID=1798473 RepID=A0A1F6C1T1_9BACT|nr:MAG: hypothetical protein A3G50_01735 [Candidatus Jorgensenbacteria bacterium RIFCSPLOWO2_12_FULL_42_11]
MHGIFTNLIGYTAAVVGTLIMLPQVIKSFRTKRTGDLSMLTLIIYIINCSLWTVYGLLLSAAPIVFSNVVGLAIVVTQLVLKLKYDS